MEELNELKKMEKLYEMEEMEKLYEMEEMEELKKLKEFNTEGLCVPDKHYMVNIEKKLFKIIKLVNRGKYFTINKARQFGKTTTLFLLNKKIESNYLVIRISFEGIGDKVFLDEKKFSNTFLQIIANEIDDNKEIKKFLINASKDVEDIVGLSMAITYFIKQSQRKVVLMIDEVDKSSNNQLFLSFLGMLRNKYLLRNEGMDNTFHSVILAGVHDVKTLKLKLRNDEEQKYNSPWNIATEFEVDMSFSDEEISTMLVDYVKEKNIKMDIKEISEKLYYYTSGYPFLVSRLCELIDKKIMKENNWSLEDVDSAVKLILNESNANFDEVIKNLENNKELYELVEEIIIHGNQKTFNIDNPIINIGTIFGILKKLNEKVKIHNKIYEQRIYNYMSSRLENISMSAYNFQDNFIENKTLNMEKVLYKFQEFMKEQYSEQDTKFLERNGRLLLLAFIKPIINGKGFDFKEIQVSEEKRLDVVITYENKKYVLELKRWQGEEAHQKGIKQLCDYLDIVGLREGYLVIFDFTKNKKKEWQKDKITINNKEIFLVFV